MLFDVISEKSLSRDLFDEHGYTFGLSEWGFCSCFQKIIYDDFSESSNPSVKRAVLEFIRYPEDDAKKNKVHTRLHIFEKPFGRKIIKLGDASSEKDIVFLEKSALAIVKEYIV